MIHILLVTILFGPLNPSAQACKQSVLPVLKPMPELEYSCDEFPNDWDEKNLKHPARVAAIKNLMAQLSSYSNAGWWQASIADLNRCDLAGKDEYVQWLFGDSRIRLVLIPDPCYQTGYGGSNAFLLYRHGTRVSVTQALDGYFSRADNSVNIAFAKLNGEDIVEISTGSGGLNPTLTNYYFAIDPGTNTVVPKNLFKGENGPTNRITSAMLFEDQHGANAPLVIIRRQTFARSFRIYEEDPDGKLEDNGRKLTQTVLRWNGKIYR